MNEDRLFCVPILVVIGLLLSPIFIFLFHTPYFALPKSLDFLNVLGWTFVQATVSTTAVLFLSVFGAMGFVSVTHKKIYFLLEAFSLLPSLLPPVILVTSVINLFELFTPFPFGLTALILFQILTYTGLCSVIFARVFLKEISALSEWAYIHSISTTKFLKIICKSILKKDLQTVTALIFVATFTSLSLPLLTAGGKAISLEFFIYEKLKTPWTWPVASTLIFLQSLFVFFIYYKAFAKSFVSSVQFHYSHVYLLKNKIFIFIPLLPSILSLAGLFFISNVKQQWQNILELKPILLEAFLNSFFIGLGVGSLVLSFLVLTSLSFQNVTLRKILVSYRMPSVTLLGFAFLILPFYGKFFVLLKWIVGLSLLFFPLVYRLRGEITLDKLNNQVEVARLFGASWLFIFRKILWPQSASVFFFCSGIAGFLACGDFAYSLIVSQSHWNLSLFVYDLLSSYRLDMAVLASWFLLIFSFLILIFWMGLAFVFDKKFKL